jgi:hypothetical protein
MITKGSALLAERFAPRIARSCSADARLPLDIRPVPRHDSRGADVLNFRRGEDAEFPERAFRAVDLVPRHMAAKNLSGNREDVLLTICRHYVFRLPAVVPV